MMYMKARFNMDLEQMSNNTEKWDFVLKSNNNIHIEYKTINLKGSFKYADNINDVKIYDLIVIGEDKIDEYLRIYEEAKIKNILKHFYYIVGFVFYDRKEVQKVKYLYSYLNLYKIITIYYKQYGFRKNLTGENDLKQHFQIPKADFHIVKHFKDILQSHSICPID